MACTLSSVLPASSALPRVSSWSPNLRPAMAAGLPGTTSDTNTPLRWAATRSPTCRYLSVIVMKEGQISLNIDLAVAILAEHHPPGQPGVNH